MKRLLGALLALLPVPALAAATPSIATIMSRDWAGTAPESPRWSDDGRALFYERRRPGSEVVDTFRVEVATGATAKVEDRELGTVDPPVAAFSGDRKSKAFVVAGDLYWRDARGRRHQVTRTGESESEPRILLDGRVAFRRGDAFYAFDPASATTATLAELRLADDPEAEDEKGFYVEQQRRYFEVLRAREAREQESETAAKARRAVDPTRAPEPWYLGKGKSLLAAELSPDGRRLAVVLGPERDRSEDDEQGADGGKPDKLAAFVELSGYVEIRDVRPKVGTGKPETSVLRVLDLAAHEARTIDFAGLPGLTDDPLSELRAAAAKARGETPASGEKAPRVLSVGQLAWNESGSRLAVQLFSYDNKDRWLAAVDPATGALAPLERASDPAWINWRFNDFGWMRDGETLWYLSEESGFSHLYLRPVAGPARQLTRGAFEVDTPVLSREGASLFVTANREHPGIVEAYRVDVRSGEMTRLTRHEGLLSFVLSPDEKQLAFLGSKVTQPEELYVQPFKAGAAARKLTDTVSTEFRAVAWSEPEVVAVPSSHGAGKVWARVYTPPGWAPDRKHPAVAFVHGAGYLQNVHHGWSSYYREFMFHTLLARRGYVVIDMDYRGSSGYGRDWRTAIYRQMGWPEVEDYEDGLKWLIENKAVDPERIGVYGGSYGGFFTFMAMFNKPHLFAAGAALRPVADWAHYNHGYTSNILNTPEVDPEAYRKSSPIEYAEGLAKPLLILHGMVDDNVTFQDSVRLVQRLIELGKTDSFETAIYPVESHAFKEPSSWTDEYKRIWNLFERTLWE